MSAFVFIDMQEYISSQSCVVKNFQSAIEIQSQQVNYNHFKYCKSMISIFYLLMFTFFFKCVLLVFEQDKFI